MKEDKPITSSSQVNIKKMSEESGIPAEEIERAFQRKNLVATENVIQKRITSVKNKIAPVLKSIEEQKFEFERKLRLLREAIHAATTADDAAMLFKEAKPMTSEETLAYNKLVELVAKEAGELTDYDDLKDLLNIAPTGISEDLVRKKLFAVMSAEVAATDDIDALRELYEKALDDSPELTLIFNKAVECCNDEDSIDSIDAWLPENHIANYKIEQKRFEIVSKQIQEETDIDELVAISNETDDELIETKCYDQMIKLINDFDSADTVEDLVPEGTLWWHEATRKMISFADQDEIESLIERLYEGTELYTLAAKKKSEFLLQQISNSDDWHEVKDIFENKVARFSDVEQVAFDKLLELSDDLELVGQVYETTLWGSVERDKATTKWDQMVLTELSIENDVEALKDLYNNARDGSNEKKQVLVKILAAVSSVNEAIDAYDFFSDYTDLRQKAFMKITSFNPSFGTAVFSSDQNETSGIIVNELLQENEPFIEVHTADAAYAAWKNATTSEEREHYAAKVGEYLEPLIKKAETVSYLKNLYLKSIPGTLTQSEIVLKMAAHFKKKGFLDFLK
jgi:hypothetical protein